MLSFFLIDVSLLSTFVSSASPTSTLSAALYFSLKSSFVPFSLTNSLCLKIPPPPFILYPSSLLFFSPQGTPLLLPALACSLGYRLFNLLQYRTCPLLCFFVPKSQTASHLCCFAALFATADQVQMACYSA